MQKNIATREDYDKEIELHKKTRLKHDRMRILLPQMGFPQRKVDKCINQIMKIDSMGERLLEISRQLKDLPI